MFGKLAKMFNKGGPTGPRVYLGAFGKHPGWDDHIDDIGLSSSRLISIKSTLYARGISENIDTAQWDQLPEDQRLSGFDHAFLWRWPDDAAVGLIWSSRDGKGRTKYPMILCAHAEGFAPGSGVIGWLRREGLRVLRGVRERCKVETTAAAVRDAVAAGLGELSANMPTSTGVEDQQGVALRHVAAAASTPEGTLGLTRVFYEIDQRLGLLRPDTKRKTKSADLSAKRFRVGMTSTRGVLDDAWAWGEATLADVGPSAMSTGMLAIEWHGEPGHVDVIVGEPDPGCLFCLRASRAREPLTSEIPFTIDDAFAAAVKARMKTWSGQTQGAADSGPFSAEMAGAS